MSAREDERFSVNPDSTTSLQDDDRSDPLDPSGARAFGDSDRLRPPEVHHAQRCHFRGRGADRLFAIGDRKQGAPADRRHAASRGQAVSPRRTAVRRPERGEERAGPGDDGGGRVLQGGAGPLELAHDRPDAHYLRLLPAVHEAPGGPARQSDGTQGAPVRQPQRHGERARHGARRARGAVGPGAGHCRSLVSRQDARRTQSVIPVEAWRQDVQSDAQRHRLRRDQRGLSITPTR